MSNVGLRPAVKIETVNVFDEEDSASDRIEITFSRIMDKETILIDLVYSGPRTMSVSGGVAIDQSWDEEGKILTIIPRDGFAESAMYSLRLIGQNGSYSGIKDVERKSLSATAPEGLGFVSFSTNYDFSTGQTPILIGIYTGAPATSIPAVPTGLAAKARSASATSAIDYRDVNADDNDWYRGGIDGVYLSWDEVDEAVAYKVYASYDGGLYQYVASYTSINSGDGSLTPLAIDSALAYFSRSGSDYPSATKMLPWPYLGKGINFKVTAVNAAGESPFSEVINVKDNVSPEVIMATSSGSEITVYFTEPLDAAAAQNPANYTIAGQTISSAVLTNLPMMNHSISGNYYCAYVTLSIVPGTWSGTVEVGATVADITGNPINETANSGTF